MRRGDVDQCVGMSASSLSHRCTTSHVCCAGDIHTPVRCGQTRAAQPCTKARTLRGLELFGVHRGFTGWSVGAPKRGLRSCWGCALGSIEVHAARHFGSRRASDRCNSVHGVGSRSRALFHEMSCGRDSGWDGSVRRRRCSVGGLGYLGACGVRPMATTSYLQAVVET